MRQIMSKLKQISCIIILTILIVFTCGNLVNATTVEVTTETLNLREEASTDSDIVALISEGEECEVISEEGDWYEVRYGDYTGYVSKEYVEVIGGEAENSTGDNSVDNNENTDTNTESNEETNTVSENEPSNSDTENNVEDSTTSNENQVEQTQQDITATTTEEVDVRTTPLMQGSILETIKNNTEVTVISQINGWAYIQTDSISGWVREDTLRIDETNGNTNNDNNNNTNNTDTTDNSDNQDTGSTNNTNDNSSNFTERTMYATDVVNIREEPSTSANIVMVVEQNTALNVVGESGDWYEVETSQVNAYVSKELLSESETTVTNRGNVDRTSNTQEKTEEEAEADNASTSNPSNSNTEAEEIVSYAKKFLGVPYVYGGASPSGFDCSGFTMYVFDHFGISMRHGAQAQAKIGKKVSFDESSKSSILNNLEVGDLVFFLDYETMDEIGHCGIYIGDGEFIHASSGSGYCVKINSLLPGEYYNTRLCAARRVL